MPYVPPGGNTVQPIAIPISKAHQIAEGLPISYTESADRHRATSLPIAEESSSSIPLSSLSLRESEDVLTPRAPDAIASGPTAAPEASMLASTEIPQPQRRQSGSQSQQQLNGITLDSLSTALASSSLSTSPKAFLSASASSVASTPPLEDSSRSLHQSSPAASSIVSLPEQEEHQHIDNVKHSNPDPSLMANRSDPQLNNQAEVAEKISGEVEEEDTEDEGRKIAGDIETKPATLTSGASEAIDGTAWIPVPTAAERDALTVYTAELYAYTKTLYIQAKLSLSRAERRRQSGSAPSQFGVKQSGMEKMAAKKALARRLNG
ncbi:hypothetical protein IAU59_001892 [Kwoniella sp. CBS 9459]